MHSSKALLKFTGNPIVIPLPQSEKNALAQLRLLLLCRTVQHVIGLQRTDGSYIHYIPCAEEQGALEAFHANLFEYQVQLSGSVDWSNLTNIVDLSVMTELPPRRISTTDSPEYGIHVTRWVFGQQAVALLPQLPEPYQKAQAPP